MGIKKQLTILLENKPGALSEICASLAIKDINIIAISVQDSIDLNLTRMVVSEPERAKDIFNESDINVIETDVLAVDLTDKPGGLAAITKQLHMAQINIEYAYGSVSPEKGKSLGIFWVSNLKKAAEVLNISID